MISILSVFWMFIILFGLIGAMRGWAKELLVIFSIVLALFLIYVLENFTPFIIPFDEVLSQVENLNPSTGFELLPVPIQDELKVQFWSRAAIVGILAFFGYQTPRLAFLSLEHSGGICLLHIIHLRPRFYRHKRVQLWEMLH